MLIEIIAFGIPVIRRNLKVGTISTARIILFKSLLLVKWKIQLHEESEAHVLLHFQRKKKFTFYVTF